MDLSMSTKIIPASSPSSVLTSTYATTPFNTLFLGLELTSPSLMAEIVAVDTDEDRTEVRRGACISFLDARSWCIVGGGRYREGWEGSGAGRTFSCPRDRANMLDGAGLASFSLARGTEYSSYPAHPPIVLLLCAGPVLASDEMAARCRPTTESGPKAGCLFFPSTFVVVAAGTPPTD
jgi:hypothetical protein